MKVRLAHGLVYVEVVVSFRGRSLHLSDVILDTGSAGTIFAADRMLEIGVAPEPADAIRRIRGIGGTEFVFTKGLDRLVLGEIQIDSFEVEIGAMDYGFPADGILGLDYLLKVGAVIDLRRLEIHRT
ncbi:MAG: aspartyl protease family protein [Acidobacteriota bacterium]